MAAVERRRAQHRFSLHLLQKRARPRRVVVVGEPDLRLHDGGRDVAGDARRVLVEHVCANAGLVQAVRDEISVEALAGDIDAKHAVHLRCRMRKAHPYREP